MIESVLYFDDKSILYKANTNHLNGNGEDSEFRKQESEMLDDKSPFVQDIEEEQKE